MARRARIVAPGTPHQISTRGNNKRRIFSDRGDYLAFIRYLSRQLEATGCQLHQLTLMVNHVHMIVTPPSAAALANLMKWTLSDYARARNRKRASCGHLFEGRFFSRVIDSPRYLAVATMYNDANLAHAGLLDDPTNHQWSTCGIHAGFPDRSSIPLRMWTPSTWYRSLGAPAERPVAYRALLQQHMVTHPLAVDPDLVAFERPAVQPYRRRVERPDGASAREAPNAVWLKTRGGRRG
ncbi:MAG TPA: transposase [Kofleriaceae bacterium]|jgi:putative transposase|nr:transposase [Kofleriaceae bacterium]